MKGNNAKFLADPAKFLGSCGIKNDEMTTNSTKASGFDFDDASIREFDLQPSKSGGFVDLVVLGNVGAYAATGRKGQPIVGHFLHWKGQTYGSGPASFGKLDLSACTANYIFTAPFSGCNFVVSEAGGRKIVYHEPTENDTTHSGYGGDVTSFGPDYGDGCLGGCGVIVRRPGGWRMIVSSQAFGTTSFTVKTMDI